jgi:predicted transcriptional regulator
MFLENYIKDNGLTYESFGKLIGVSDAAVSRYVKGKRKPKPSIMSKIIKITQGKVTANDFYK